MKSLPEHHGHGSDMPGRIVAFAKANPKPTYGQLREWATANGVLVDKAETEMFQLAVAIFIGGRSKGSKKAYDAEQLRKGIDVEMEHLDRGNPFSVFIATKIASDHLQENPRYYSWLEWMEKNAERYKNPADFEAALRGE